MQKFLRKNDINLSEFLPYDHSLEIIEFARIMLEIVFSECEGSFLIYHLGLEYAYLSLMSVTIKSNCISSVAVVVSTSEYQ